MIDIVVLHVGDWRAQIKERVKDQGFPFQIKLQVNLSRAGGDVWQCQQK